MEDEQPSKPPAKSGFRGRRPQGRRLSYKRKGDKKRSATWVDYKAAVESGAVPGRPQENATTAEQPRGLKHRILPREIKSKLAQTEAEVEAAHVTIQKQTRTINALKKTKEALKATAAAARKSAREAKAHAKVDVDLAKQSADASNRICEGLEMRMESEVAKAVEKEEVRAPCIDLLC